MRNGETGRSDQNRQKETVQQMRKQKGFSLIELLIVVAIILIIAAIAIPNLLRARIAANESSAVAAVRTLNTAQISYNSTYPTVGYAATLDNLSGTSCTGAPTSAAACLIDTVLGNAPYTKSGYTFAMAVTTGGSPSLNVGYQASTAPLNPNQTGVRYFCSFEDAVVRSGAASLAGTACTSAAAPLQ
jgi:type IV pilus assembly protein PilA